VPRRKHLPFNGDYRPADVLELVSEPLADACESFDLVIESPARRASRAPTRSELPPRAPVPLEAIEEAWHLGADWLEPYLARSIELSGGFRPTLERAGLRCDSAG